MGQDNLECVLCFCPWGNLEENEVENIFRDMDVKDLRYRYDNDQLGVSYYHDYNYYNGHSRSILSRFVSTSGHRNWTLNTLITRVLTPSDGQIWLS